MKRREEQRKVKRREEQRGEEKRGKRRRGEVSEVRRGESTAHTYYGYIPLASSVKRLYPIGFISQK